MIDGWKVYNHALIPTTPPHEKPNLKVLKSEKIWKTGCLLVRYTTEFDCGYETEWWWLIKDNEMSISNMKKKRRYEITKGMKNFNVRKISPKDYAEQLYMVYRAAFQNYKNAGTIERQQSFINRCIQHQNDTQIDYYGAFDKENGELAGYALNYVYEDYVDLSIMKFAPNSLSKNVSAALIYTMLCEYLNDQQKKYVTDGERSIRHVTNFQDYLIKYFGFRRAYCKLHVYYRPILGLTIKVLYPFHKVIKKMAKIPSLHNVGSLLDMEVIRRSFEKSFKIR